MRKLPNYLTLILLTICLSISSCSKDNNDTIPETETANAEVSSSLKNILDQVNAANSSTSGDEENDDDDDYGDDCIEFFECFEFQYPLTVIQTDGTEVELLDDEALFDFIEAQEDDYEPNFVFPITIIFDDGDETEVLNNLEDLEDAFDDCEEEFECFELIYPIQLIDDNDEVVTINNEEELFAFLDAQDEDYEIDVVYPIDVMVDDEVVTINNDDEMEELYEECDDDWDDVMCFEFVYPLEMTQNGETVIIENEDTLFDFIEGIEDGEDVDFVYPFDVILDDDTTATISNSVQLFELFDSCF